MCSSSVPATPATCRSATGTNTETHGTGPRRGDRRDRPGLPAVTVAIGIDVGGTKIAAGLVDTRERRGAAAPSSVPTRPERGGEAVLADCACLAGRLGATALPVGVGICEVVGLDGRVTSAETVDWRGLDVASAFGAAPVRSSPTSGRRRWPRPGSGPGPGSGRFSSAVVGTGASACLVVERPAATGRPRQCDHPRLASGGAGRRRARSSATARARSRRPRSRPQPPSGRVAGGARERARSPRRSSSAAASARLRAFFDGIAAALRPRGVV